MEHGILLPFQHVKSVIISLFKHKSLLNCSESSYSLLFGATSFKKAVIEGNSASRMGWQVPEWSDSVMENHISVGISSAIGSGIGLRISWGIGLGNGLGISLESGGREPFQLYDR